MTQITGIIVEPRKHAALKFVLQNAIECLPLDTKIVLFHGQDNYEYSMNIVSSLQKKEQIQLVNLNVSNLDLKEYSRLLCTKSIIYEHIHTKYFLVFQTDSMFFKKYCHLLESFISENIDYVGAPWSKCNYQQTQIRDYIGNGGLSLRKTSKMLEIIEKYDWTMLINQQVEWYEDLFFTLSRVDTPIKKPTWSKSKLFSVDEVFSPITLGCHKVWISSHYLKFVEIFPEVEQLRSLQYIDE